MMRASLRWKVAILGVLGTPRRRHPSMSCSTPHAVFEHAPPSDEHRFVCVISGALADGLTVGDAVGYAAGEAPIRVHAGDRGAHLVVAGGRPLAQPAVFHGPFCMTTHADIDRAITRYRTGAMGQLAASF